MDEVQNLLLRVQGEMDMKRLNKELERGNELLGKLMKQQAEGVDKKASIIAIAKNQLDRHKELDDIAKDLATKIPKGSQFSTQGMQNLGYALQDFVSAGGGFAQKLNSITNNLQQVAVSFGVGGGWFLAITGAITAVQLFANNWEKISAAVQGLPSPEEVKAKAEAVKTQQATAAGMISGKPAFEEAKAAGAKKGITEIGGGKFGVNIETAVSRTPIAAGFTEEQSEAWAAEHLNEFMFRPQSEMIAARNQAENAQKTVRAKAEVTRLLAKMNEVSPEGDAARSRVLELMKSNPDLFSAADIKKFEEAIAPEDQSHAGPPVPEQDAARFADLQRQLEEREGRSGRTIDAGPLGGAVTGAGAPQGITYGGRFPGGAPTVPDAGAAADAQRQIGSNRQARGQALASGRAGPLIDDGTSPRRRRRRYQQTGVYDPDVMAAHQQVNQMLNEATMNNDIQSQQQLRPGMMELNRKLQALQRRMGSQLGGMPPGQYSSMPENW